MAESNVILHYTFEEASDAATAAEHEFMESIDRLGWIPQMSTRAQWWPLSVERFHIPTQ